MKDQELKNRYRNLYYNLSSINNRFNSIKGSANNIKAIMGETLKINKRVFEKENLEKLASLENSVSSSISNTLNSVKYYM